MTEPEKPDAETKPAPTPKKAADKTDKRPRRRRRRWPWILAALVILFVAGAVAGIYYLPALKDHLPFVAAWLPAQKPDAELAQMQARLNALEGALATVKGDVARHGDDISDLRAANTRLATSVNRVEALAQTVNAAPSVAAPVEQAQEKPPPKADEDKGPLAARLDMLMLRVGQIESAFVPLSEKVTRQEGAAAETATLAAHAQTLDERIKALNNRLDRLEQSASADAKQALLVLTYASLRRAAEAGRSIAAETQALGSLAQGKARAALGPALDRLTALSTTATPSLTALKEQFPVAVDKILDAARLPDNAKWWQRIWARITGLVTVRKTGEISGDSAAAIVSRAESRLGDGDLKGAVDALQDLTGSAARAAAPWLAEAGHRLALDAALDNVEDGLRSMAAKPAPAPDQGS